MSQTRELTRGLGLWPAVAINVGNMIGSGIFLKTRVMTCNVGTSASVIVVWILGGVLALLGAFAYSEVAAMMPEAGGEYVYLRRAYGRVVSFLCGWTLFLLQKCGSQAALAVGFAIFMNVATGGHLHRAAVEFSVAGHTVRLDGLTLMAVASIWIIAFINSRSVAQGGGTALGLTSLKVGFLLCLAVAALSFGHGDIAHFGQSNVGGICEGVSANARGGIVGFGAALLGVLWVYDGWSNVAPLLGELRNPERNVSRVFVSGTLLVAALYVLVTIAYFYVLSPTGVANVPASSSVATEVLKNFVGPVAVTVLALAMMVSAFGSQQASALAGPRIAYAMARNGMFFNRLGVLSPRSRAPVAAIVFQAAGATVLAMSGTYDTLTDAAMIGAWLIYGLTVAAVFVLRRREPDAPRPYRCFGYPVLPMLFVLVVAGVIANAFIATPREALLGSGLILLGLPFYAYWSRRGQPTR